MITKLKKIKGLKIEEFNKHLNPKNEDEYERIFSNSVRLIPLEKLGDEKALVSVFLSSLKLIDEFRENIFNEIKLKNVNRRNKEKELLIYREVSFNDREENEDSRIDGLILIVKNKIIEDVALFEMKNKSDELKEKQIEKYINIANNYNISKIVTISNQFVMNSSQTPLNLKVPKNIQLYHLSWSYILTHANLLLFKEKENSKEKIEDEDQVAIMKEVVAYFEDPRAGVLDFSQMKEGWKKVCEEVRKNEKIDKSNKDLESAILSWIQEEKDMTLKLSRKLGILVTSDINKYKNNLQLRVKEDIEKFVKDFHLYSSIKIKDAVSDLYIDLNIKTNMVFMSVCAKPRKDNINAIRQLKDLLLQIEKSKKINEEKFRFISKDLVINPIIKKKINNNLKIEYNKLDDYSFGELNKDAEIKEFQIIYSKKLPFENSKIFIKLIEEMLFDFYGFVVVSLEKPIPPKAIKLKEEIEVKEELKEN